MWGGRDKAGESRSRNARGDSGGDNEGETETGGGSAPAPPILPSGPFHCQTKENNTYGLLAVDGPLVRGEAEELDAGRANAVCLRATMDVRAGGVPRWVKVWTIGLSGQELGGDARWIVKRRKEMKDRKGQRAISRNAVLHLPRHSSRCSSRVGLQRPGRSPLDERQSAGRSSVHVATLRPSSPSAPSGRPQLPLELTPA